MLIQITVSYIYFSETVNKKTETNFRQIISQTNKGIDATLYSYEKMTQNIIASEVIQNNLKQLLRCEKNNEVVSQIVQDELSTITLSEELISSIQIIPKDHQTINYVFSSNYVDYTLLDATCYESIKSKYWYKRVIESYGEIFWLSEVLIPRVDQIGMERRVFSSIRKINDLDTGKELAILIVNLDERKIHHVMEGLQLGDSSKVYLIDEDQMIISTTDRGLIGSKFDLSDYNLSQYNILREKSLETNWEIVALVPKEEYQREMTVFNRMFIYLGLTAIIAIAIASMFISKGVTKPIIQLIHGMNKVKKGKFDVAIAVETDDEIGQLANHFNVMTKELEFFVKKAYIQELNRREVELKAVQAQLNPHFLYNTLDTIYWKLVLSDNEEIADLVVSLSEILRYSINSDQEFVSVEEDMQQIDNYLQIQKSRFEEQIEFKMQVAPDIVNYKIPKLIIQPLVENAIIHGFKNFNQKGLIEVKGYKLNKELIFEVVDNGIGMSEDTIHNLLKRDASEDKASGYGLDVVNKRIKILYGEDFGIHINSILGKGTRMIVRLDLYVHRG
jgi:two-component system sensor histidine kinase YesM